MGMSAAAASPTHFPSTNLHRHSAALLCHRSSISTCRFPLRSLSSSVRMSTSPSQSTPNQIVEHIVLFKVKPSADPSAVNAMVTNLNALKSLDSVLHISTGALFRCRSAAAALTFTHMLHSRYRSKTDLTDYAKHPAHVSVVSNYVKPIIEDVMAVDWIADDFGGAAIVPPGSALRLTVLKLKEGAGEAGKRQVVELARGMKVKLGSIEQMTVGENFSPERAKGFSICSMAVFKGSKELESAAEIANAEWDKAGELLDGVLALDYAMQAPQLRTANL